MHMVRRNGLPSLLRITRILCDLINTFEHTIRKQYPNNTPLLVALEAALIACKVFHEEIDKIVNPVP